MSTTMVKTKLNGQYEIIIPKHRADRPEWHTDEGWEKKRLKSMQYNLYCPNPDLREETIYYVGAEEGEMAALCQIWGAKVVMFEPNPKAWSHIRAIWEANQLKKPLAIFPGFASNITKKAVKSDFTDLLKLGEDGWPLCSNEEMEAAHGFKELAVEGDYFDQITIDDFTESTRIIPTAISLDVEGSEWQVLRGAKTCLETFHPKIWLSAHAEFMYRIYGEYLADLRTWIINLGYKEELLDYPMHECHFYYHKS